ncbi:MAG: hypothetical protein WCG36_01995, partial [bacterium]
AAAIHDQAKLAASGGARQARKAGKAKAEDRSRNTALQAMAQHHPFHPIPDDWVAGKLTQDEVAGLGRLRWLYSDSTSGIEDSEKNHLYEKETLNPEGIKLKVPAFLALASSQVEGDPVVSQTDNVNAEGKIITVYMPLPSYKNPTRGDKLLIYH